MKVKIYIGTKIEEIYKISKIMNAEPSKTRMWPNLGSETETNHVLKHYQIQSRRRCAFAQSKTQSKGVVDKEQDRVGRMIENASHLRVFNRSRFCKS